MVTAELATALPVLVLLAFAGIVAIGIGQARVRCADAAREAARAVARGDAGSADAWAAAVARRPVTVVRSRSADQTRVTVSWRLKPISWLPAMTVSDTAVVATEPGPSP
ncbi:MAG: hypothetical protein QOK10_492 [Pseudonocardiales bacterium]|jgi:hypothetical protein|nr:hypothetical protein [Pseudonocardiales bacterium]